MGKKEVWNFSDKKKKIDNVVYYTNIAYIDKERAEELANQGRARRYTVKVLPLKRKRSEETWWAVYMPVAEKYRGMSASQRLKMGPQFTRKQSCICCISITVFMFVVYGLSKILF